MTSPASVRFLAATLGVMCIACSDATQPPAPDANSIARTQVTAGVPYAAGIHVAAIPGLDGGGIASDLNDIGEIVGSGGNPGIDLTAFSWTPTFGLRKVNQLATMHGVNNNAQVALTVVALPGDSAGTYAAIWDWFGNVRRLRHLSSFFTHNPTDAGTCQAAGINNHGVVIGQCHIAGTTAQFLTIWTPFGTPYPVSGQLVQTTPYAISDAGFVAAGDTVQLEISNPSVFSPTGQRRRLPLHPLMFGNTPTGAPLAVNDSGWAAGFQSPFDPTCASNSAANSRQAVAWLEADTVVSLGSAACGDLGATGITDDGTVVGTSRTPPSTSSARFAWVWTAATGLLRLPGLEGGAALALEESAALAVNHRHQVLGWVITANGVHHTVIWTLR